MPVIIPEDLPAFSTLTHEGVEVISHVRAERQDIRPLEVAILNLMPDKITTETQLARLIGASPLQIDLTLLVTGSYTPKNAPQSHLRRFYTAWEEIARSGRRFDALIVTGAPVEHIPFEEVAYWPELAQIFDWAQQNVFTTLGICWGGQAIVHHHYGLEKYLFPEKLFGVFPHRARGGPHPLLRGLNDVFDIPVSRHAELREADLAGTPLEVLIASEQAGLCMLRDRSRRFLAMFNHWEYDTDTLGREYRRDLEAGQKIKPPFRYFAGDDPKGAVSNTWRSNGYLFFTNWLNEIYRDTPYDLADLPAVIAAG